MTPRTIARVLAAGRVALGAALVAAPGPLGRRWIGADADRTPVAVLTRALGVRDLILGMIALHTVDHPEVGPRWQRTVAAADLVDLTATLAARRSLTAGAVAGVGALAGGAAALELWASTRLGGAGAEEMAEPTG